MKTGVLRRGLGLALLYIGVFFLIVVLQFGRSGGFLARSGQLAVSASWAASDRKGPPATAKVDFAGFAITLSRSTPAHVVLADGSRRDLSLKSVEKLPGGARILFEGGGELRATADPGSANSFRLLATRPRPEAIALSLPWGLSRRAGIDSAAGAKSLLRGAGGPYELVLGGNTLDRDGGELSLMFADSDSSAIALRRIAQPTVVAVKEPAPAKVLPQAPMDPAAYKAVVDGFVAKTWTGLSSARWDPDRLAWRDSSGASVFTEKALAAYLAEAASRGGWADGYARARAVATRNASSITWFTTPYFGNTVERMTAREAQDLSEVRRLTSLSQSTDAAMLEKEGLVHFLLDRSPYSLAQSSLQAIGGMDAGKFTTRQAVGYLAAAVESRGYLSEADNPFKAADAVSDRLIGALAKIQDAWFLKTEDDGSIDLRQSVVAGLALISWGQASSKDVLVGVGQSLVAGALGLADASGFLPARLAPRPDGGADRSGSLAPEELYPLVASGAYYPREISFYKDLGPGAWAYTCAPGVTASGSPSSAVLTVTFPVGYAHFMAIYGLKPFGTIKLYGINYSPDSAFESYDVSGYLYRKASNALYLKMKHKQGAEKIELYY